MDICKLQDIVTSEQDLWYLTQRQQIIQRQVVTG
jgi:hypothetical protein